MTRRDFPLALAAAALLAVLAGLAAQPAAAPPAPPPDATFRPWAGVPVKGDYTVYISAVHDGDTVTACLLVPLDARIFGINSAELATPAGKDAQKYAAGLLAGKMFPARLYGREKFGRILADFTMPDGRWFSDTMIAANQAKKYDGHGPRP